MVSARDFGEGSRELFNGDRVSVLQDETVSGHWLQNNVNRLNTAELVHLKMAKVLNLIF